MKYRQQENHKPGRRPAGAGVWRRGFLLGVCITASATAFGQTVEEQQLEQIENLVVIAWYFSLFCAFALGFKAGLVR